MEGQDSIPSVLGPLSTSISGIKAFTKAVIDGKPWTKDPLAIRKVWDEDAYQLKEHGNGEELCIAIQWDNGVVLPTPPIRRSLEMTKKALEAKGIKGTTTVEDLLMGFRLRKAHTPLLLSLVVDWPSFEYGELCNALVRKIMRCEPIRHPHHTAHAYLLDSNSSGEPALQRIMLRQSRRVESPFLLPCRPKVYLSAVSGLRLRRHCPRISSGSSRRSVRRCARNI